MCGRYYIDERLTKEVLRIVRIADRDVERRKNGTAEGTITDHDAERRENGNAEVTTADRNALHGIAGDICPSETAPVIVGDKGATDLVICRMKWGFPVSGSSRLLINARSETAMEKPLFADGIKRHRCVLPASGFYEWDAGKNKVTFRRSDHGPLYLAGFYKLYEDGARFVILTREANASMSPVHDRMPLFFEEKEVADWIGNDTGVEQYLCKELPLLEAGREYEQLSLFQGQTGVRTTEPFLKANGKGWQYGRRNEG